MAHSFVRALGRGARLLIPCSVVALSACSSSTDGTAPSASSTMSVSFAAAPDPSSANDLLGGAGALFDSSTANSANSIVLTKVQLVLSHIELSRIDSACVSADTTNADDDHEQEHRGDCHEIKLAPVLVDVPLTAGAKMELSAPIPAGTYRNLHARIDALRAGSKQVGAADFLAANKDFDGTSIRVEGTYNGKAFVYTSDVRAEINVRFDPPITVADGTKPSVTVAVDPTRWFKTAHGTTIDPTTSGKDQPNNRVIAENIRRSFRVFRDDDHDGHGDHESKGQH